MLTYLARDLEDYIPCYLTKALSDSHLEVVVILQWQYSFFRAELSTCSSTYSKG